MKEGLKKSLLYAAVCASGFVVAALVFRPVSPTDEPVDEALVLARFGDQVITIAEFQDEMARRGGHLPNQFHTLEQKRELLDAMIEARRQLAAARAAGYDQHPEVLRIHDRTTVSKFHEEELEQVLAGVVVSDEDIRNWYQQHQDEYAVPPRYRAALILLPAPADGSESGWDSLRKQASELLEQVAELPVDINHFGALAREHSAHRGSRYNGGAVAWLVDHPGKNHPWDAAVVASVFALEQPGELAPAVETKQGIFLLRLMVKESAQPRPFERVADGIRYHLERQLRKDTKEEVLSRLIDSSRLEVFEQRLSMVEPLNPRTASKNSGPPALPKS